MKPSFSIAKTAISLGLTVIIIGHSALSQQLSGDKKPVSEQQSVNEEDTTKLRKRGKEEVNHDRLELEMKRLDIEMKRLDNEMKRINVNIDKESLKQLDMEKIQAQVDEALAKIDWEKMNRELKENTTRMEKVDMTAVRRQMEKVRADLQKQKASMRLNAMKMDTRKIKEGAEKSIKEARKSIIKAREEIRSLQEFTEALEKDGLIDKSKPYRIDVKDGELFINDKKQPKEMSDKYRKYYKKDNFSINMTDGNNYPI